MKTESVAIGRWLVVAMLLTGCDTTRKRAPLPSAPPPRPVSTIEVRAASRAISGHTEAAKTRVETIIKTVEVIREKPTTDPETARALGAVQGELFKVSAELRESQTVNATLVAAVAQVDKDAEQVRLWGAAQQLTAEANATGWRNEEVQHGKAKVDAAKWHASSDRRGNILGWLGAGTLGLVGGMLMKFLPMPYSLALPVLGAGAGYFLTRMIL